MDIEGKCVDPCYGTIDICRGASNVRQKPGYTVPDPLPASYRTDESYLIEWMELIAYRLEYEVPVKGLMTKPAR